MKVKCANCGVMGEPGQRRCPYAPDGPEAMDATMRRYISCALEDGPELAAQLLDLAERLMVHACEPDCDRPACAAIRHDRDLLHVAAAALEYRAKE